MKLYHPAFFEPIVLTENEVNVIIIENEALFYKLIKELKYQVEGFEGEFVLSSNNVPVETKKHIELITDVISLNCNEKKIINGINSKLVSLLLNEEHFAETTTLVGDISSYFARVLSEFDCSVDFDDPITTESLVKAIGLKFNENYDSLSEKIYDYVRLVFEFLKKDVFVFVNLKQYVSDADMEKIYKYFEYEKHHLILFEGSQKDKLNGEKHLIIDKDLCIF